MSHEAEAGGGAARIYSRLSTALSWFNHVCIARDAVLKTGSLMPKLDNAELRLSRWGHSVDLCVDTSKLSDEQKDRVQEPLDRFAGKFATCFFDCLADEEEKSYNIGIENWKYDEVEPFGPDWPNPTTRHLHEKTQALAAGRRRWPSMLVSSPPPTDGGGGPERIVIYKKTDSRA
ncbi:uncharacterized protein PG986_011272 [Apiospora aurea]|uniref:Prion-inhibition and propagation HeLo domain-containing protein n=1 Tax=Apiospora aurea TaxID=335848 RepID=A0ABR1Q4M0_9PEZI